MRRIAQRSKRVEWNSNRITWSRTNIKSRHSNGSRSPSRCLLRSFWRLDPSGFIHGFWCMTEQRNDLNISWNEVGHQNLRVTFVSLWKDCGLYTIFNDCLGGGVHRSNNETFSAQRCYIASSKKGTDPSIESTSSSLNAPKARNRMTRLWFRPLEKGALLGRNHTRHLILTTLPVRWMQQLIMQQLSRPRSAVP